LSAVRRTLPFLALVALLLALPACGKKEPAAAPRRTTTTKSSTTTTAPDPVVPKGAVRAPLTGLALKHPLIAWRPPLAVKIDNIDTRAEHARPQAGIVTADVVFEEIVEGGITRLVAVFQSQLPPRVGPVRSARTTDPMMLGQLGRPMLAWSGGNAGVVSAVHNSSLIDMGFDAHPPAYSRDSSRRAPHNLFADVKALYAAAPKDAPPAKPLFNYRNTGEKMLPTAKKATGVTIDFGGVASVRVTYQYDPHVDGWRRGQNGTTHVDDQGNVVAPRNVVILFTNYLPSPADARSPEAQTVGSGEAWVFTKGRVIGGTWRRDAANLPYGLTDLQGHPIELTPGKTWIELPHPGSAKVFS
jgi:predicted small lipoprotein YifL